MLVQLSIVKIVDCRNTGDLATCRYSKRLYQQQRTLPIVEKQAENDEKLYVSLSIITRKSSHIGIRA